MILRKGVIIIQSKKLLTHYSEQQRLLAMEKFHTIQPYLEKILPINKISIDSQLSIRTLRMWVSAYRRNGLAGLIRKERNDFRTMKMSEEVQRVTKQIAIKNKSISIASIHRKVCTWCISNEFPLPSYYQIRKIIRNIPKNITTLAHEGSKNYANKFDLVHIRESSEPNQIWQADHTLLDIEIYNSKGVLGRPWLTVIMDDYSRAIAGYFIEFDAPSSIRTALTLRQAIWRKKSSLWPVCGIPENFYTDHGSDFTSIHIEQVAVDIKMNLLFSKVGVPRGRGKIERFFRTVNTMLLEELPGYIRGKKSKKFLAQEEFICKFEDWLLTVYHQKVHSTTKEKPILKWNQADFLPNMPDSLDHLDLLLLMVKKERVVHSDGIHLFGLKYVHTHLAAFVSESVEIRYDPRDISEVRVFYNRRFLCTAVSTVLENYSIGIKEIEKERNKIRRGLSKEIKTTTNSIIDSLKQEKRAIASENGQRKKLTLRRYENE